MRLSECANSMLARLNAFQAMQASCNEVFCSTCGGKFAALRAALTPDLRTEIRNSISLLSVEELAELGDWAVALEEIAPASVKEVYSEAAKSVNPDDLGQIDQYLLLARKYYGTPGELGSMYQRLLEEGISTALSTGNSSLVETLILVLGKDALKHEELLSLALTKKNEPNMARVLYNKLRGEVPDVRGFSGSQPTRNPSLK